jgi:hypothetical protein
MRRAVLCLLPLIVLAVAACAPGSSPDPGTGAPARSSPSATVTASLTTDLPLAAGTLPPGSYTRSDFRPPITFELGEGWSVGSVAARFFDVQQLQGTPDVIAVQFARVGSVIGTDGATVEAVTAADAVGAIKANSGLVTIDESESRLGGQTGTVVEVENRGPAHAPIFDVPAGRLGIDARRRLWIALFDTSDGVLAVMVGGSAAEWDKALTLAEPVLESIVIGA